MAEGVALGSPTLPGVSVVVPAYQAAATLGAALESILAQERGADEILVVDDGSTDGSSDVAARFEGVTVLRQPNQGDAAARNAGVRVARGAFLAFLDADDVWMPEKIRVQLGFLEAHPEADAVLAHHREVLAPGAVPPPGFRRELLEGAHPGRLLGTLVARRRAFERVGLLDPSYRSGSDSDWFCRASDARLVMPMLPDVLLERRVRSDSLTAGAAVRNVHAELLRAAPASLRRKTVASAGQGSGTDGTGA